jgi:hypothetical protein
MSNSCSERKGQVRRVASQDVRECGGGLLKMGNVGTHKDIENTQPFPEKRCKDCGEIIDLNTLSLCWKCFVRGKK